MTEEHPRKRINRPSAVHLTLPLVNRHSFAFSGLPSSDEEGLLTVPSSSWTISAVPKSSASMYSQDSYTHSPLAFSDNRIDPRRFAVAISPSQDGPWTQPVQVLQSANQHLFMLDIPGPAAESSMNEAPSPKLGETVQNQEHFVEEKNGKKVGVASSADRESIISSEAMVQEKIRDGGETKVSRDNANLKWKKVRVSSKAFGKMLSKLSVHQRSRLPEPDVEDEAPLLLSLPPQILVSLPSPELKVPNDFLEEHVAGKSSLTSDPKNYMLLPRNRSTLPSTWKPRRPPSPLPRALRKSTKHRRKASSVSHLTLRSPPPPLPTLAKLAPPVLSESPEAMYPNFASFSTPLRSPIDVTPPIENINWEDLQMRLRVRALKSATYAIHNGGIISPTSS